MPIEVFPEMELAAQIESGEILSSISALEKKGASLVLVKATLSSWDRIQSTLCSLRAANVAPLLTIIRDETELSSKQIEYVFTMLRDWDQLSVHNFLQLCRESVPADYIKRLETEAKIELKWFQEWLVASSDSRIHHYPGLPWRAYVRKVVGENFNFALAFTALAQAKNEPDLCALLDHFLEQKKKVICIFPKKWGNA